MVEYDDLGNQTRAMRDVIDRSAPLYERLGKHMNKADIITRLEAIIRDGEHAHQLEAIRILLAMHEDADEVKTRKSSNTPSRAQV